MRRHARLAGAASFGAAVLAGCALLVDTESLSGGRVPADAAAPEAARPPGADAGPPSTCDATFCDDFDRTALGETWTRSLVDVGMEITLVNEGVSRPRALRARLTGPSRPADRYAMLERDLARSGRVRCEVSARIARPPEVRFVDLFVLKTSGEGLPRYDMRLSMSREGTAGIREDLFYPDGGCECPRRATDVGAIAAGRWIRIAVETDFQTVKVSLDDVVVANGPMAGVAPSGPLKVGLGVVAYGGETAADVLFDDLACNAAP